MAALNKVFQKVSELKFWQFSILKWRVAPLFSEEKGLIKVGPPTFQKGDYIPEMGWKIEEHAIERKIDNIS